MGVVESIYEMGGLEDCCAQYDASWVEIKVDTNKSTL